jgi:hypothetical protein
MEEASGLSGDGHIMAKAGYHCSIREQHNNGGMRKATATLP